MKKGLFSLRALGLGVAMAAVAVVPAQAAPVTIDWASLSTAVNTASCTSPLFSEPFAAWRDSNLYALAPGQAADDFGGAGWILTGGARIATTTLADGVKSRVLDIPTGGYAVSPPMCVTNAYPTARTMVREVDNGAGLKMSVVYTSDGSWQNPVETGTVHGPGTTWAPSGTVNIHPGKMIGWQEARFAFVGVGQETQLYNFYVDPRMK